MQTITIDQDGVHIVLARSTIADARIRRGLYGMLSEENRMGENATFIYFITQIVECQGLPFGKVLVLPTEEQLQDMLDDWGDTDEAIYIKIVDAINALREGGADQKKSDQSAQS